MGTQILVRLPTGDLEMLAHPVASLLLLLLLLPVSCRATPPLASFAILDPANFERYLNFGDGDGAGLTNENEWAKSNIPFFETDSEDFNVAYYFRWHMFHSHMNASGWTDKLTGELKWSITEFTNVAATHSGSAGHHLMEARWLRDPKVVKDYAEYWASGASRAYTCLHVVIARSLARRSLDSRTLMNRMR